MFYGGYKIVTDKYVFSKNIVQIMNKVTTEITKDGWITTIEYNGVKYTERYEFHDGVGKAVEGNLDHADVPKDLYDAVVKLTEYNVMYALQKV